MTASGCRSWRTRSLGVPSSRALRSGPTRPRTSGVYVGRRLDGGLAVASGSRELLTWSLSVARVKKDESGNSKLVKGASNNTVRDDVAQAFLLAGGALDRERRRPEPDMSVVFG